MKKNIAKKDGQPMNKIFLFILCCFNFSLISSISFAQEASLPAPLPRVYESAQGDIDITQMEDSMSDIFRKYLGENSSFYIRTIRWTYDPMAYINYGVSVVNPWVPGTQAEYTMFFTSHDYSGNHQVKCRLLVWNGSKTIGVRNCVSQTSAYWSKVSFNLKFNQIGL